MLRSQKELSMGIDFVPKLVGQAEFEKVRKQDANEGVNDIVH